MAFREDGKVWMNGKLVDWKNATIHIASHVIHYGTSVFEGIRCYNTKIGPAVFRLYEHIDRLFNSAKIYRMEPKDFTREDICKACIETIKANNYQACYIRPIIYRGYNSLGVNPFPCPVDTSIMVWEWGAYLGAEAIEHGVDVEIANWNRIAPNTLPAMAKTGANYMNSQLIKMNAIVNGYSEGIALDVNGYVSEGSGENIFVVWNGKIYTTPLGASVLPGITRHSVIVLARELGYEVVEQLIPREMLYIADEVFFSGTAAEITPVRSIDKIPVGKGTRGPITQKIQERFRKAILAEDGDVHKWLTKVE